MENYIFSIESGFKNNSCQTKSDKTTNMSKNWTTDEAKNKIKKTEKQKSYIF